jgi:single-strand DNA-binding protein
MIEVHGALRVADDYTDRDGNKRYGRPYILANDVGFCGSKSSTKKDAMPSSPTTAPAYSSGNTGDFQALPDDDDLPF